MTFDVKKFLMEDLGLDEAEATATAAKIKAEKAAGLETRYRSQASLDAAAAEIENTRKQLQIANDKLNAEMAEWATLSTKEKSEATELRASLEAARVRTVQLETRMTALAQEHGVDPAPLLAGTTPIPPKKEEPVVPAVDPSKFVAQDQFGSVVGFALDLPAALDHIQREHYGLTGQYLDARDIVKEIKARATQKGAVIDPVAIWEEKYKVGELRAAKSKKELDDQIAAAEARGEERARSQQVPGNQPAPGRRAIVFGNRNDAGQFTPRTSVLNRPAPQSTVMQAATAFRTGKYRQSATR